MSKFNFQTVFKRRVIDSTKHKDSVLVHVLIESDHFGTGRIGLFHLPYYVEDVSDLTDYDWLLLHRRLQGSYWSQKRCENTKFLEIQYNMPADMWHLCRSYLKVRIISQGANWDVIYDVTADALKYVHVKIV